jgi:hypothetical protein
MTIKAMARISKSSGIPIPNMVYLLKEQRGVD